MDNNQLRRSICVAVKALSERKEEVNKLNVFPVPDGDTGTNMSLTMESVVREVTSLAPDADATALAKAVTHGSLMGARGNSGVIMSQILRGLCEGLLNAGPEYSTENIAVSLKRSVEVAFQAVRKPVKGTMLTVLEDVAAVAQQAAEQGLTPEEQLQKMADEALASVKRTPEFLPVLKENGVVDSGGFGLTILVQSFAAAMQGQPVDLLDASEFTNATAKVAIEQVHDWAGSKYMYCTEFLLHSDDIDTIAATKFLASIGDCELLVGDHPDFKVHVHCDTPGSVISYMTERGQISEVFIHNMVLESEERAADLAAKEAEDVPEHKNLAFIAVAAGSGMKAILESLGVDYVVSGGQTMNPSTADLLEAIEHVNADSVIFLPNNKNIIMAANAAAENAGIPTTVVPTTNVPSSFAAMFSADRQAGMEVCAKTMTSALEGVHCGEVTTAIRDAKTSKGQAICPGDIIGIADGSLDVVGDTVEQVTLALVAKIDAEGEFDTVTLLAGADFDDEALAALAQSIENEFDELEVDAQRGEQPLYPIVFALE